MAQHPPITKIVVTFEDGTRSTFVGKGSLNKSRLNRIGEPDRIQIVASLIPDPPTGPVTNGGE